MITAEQARRIQDLHTAFVRRQSAKGVDGPVPPGRKEGSDYNQHFSILESSGADWDEYDRQVREILGLPPLGEEMEPPDFGSMRANLWLAGADVIERSIGAMFAGVDEIERRYDIRVDKGFQGGGRFRKLSDQMVALLTDWSKGDGPDDPLDEFDRDQLLKTVGELRKKAATAGDADGVARLTPRRNASKAELKLALYDDAVANVRGARQRDSGVRAPEVTVKAPRARKAAPKAMPRVATSAAGELSERQEDYLFVAASDRGLRVGASADMRRVVDSLRDRGLVRQGRDNVWRVTPEGRAELERVNASVAAAKAALAKKAAPSKLSAAATPDISSLRQLGDKEAIRDQLDLLTLDKIKPLLRDEKLPLSGKKRDLVDRLVEHLSGGGVPGDGGALAPSPKQKAYEAVAAAAVTPEAFRAMSKDERLQKLRDVAAAAEGDPLVLGSARSWGRAALDQLTANELRDLVDELADISNWGTSEKRDRTLLRQAVMNLTGLNPDGRVDTAQGWTSFAERLATGGAPVPKATPAKRAPRAGAPTSSRPLSDAAVQAALDELPTTRAKRAQLRKWGFTPEQIDALVPLKRSEDWDDEEVERAGFNPDQPRGFHGRWSRFRRWHSSLDGLNDLVSAVESGEEDRMSLRGGLNADIHYVEHRNGGESIEKIPLEAASVFGHGAPSAKQQADAEQLASQLGRSIGAPVPRVLRTADDKVNMDVVEGRPWAQHRAKQMARGATKADLDAELERLANSREGTRLGAYDILIGNWDRNNPDNWFVDEDRVAGIDHAYAWAEILPNSSVDDISEYEGMSPFAQQFIREGDDGFTWADNPLTRSDINFLREQLAALEDDFTKLGRHDWWEFAKARLEAIAPHATGTDPIFT